MRIGPAEQVGSLGLIESLERRRLHALFAPDLDDARRLHADDYQLIPPGGSPITGTEYLGLIERGEMVYAGNTRERVGDQPKPKDQSASLNVTRRRSPASL